jgi:hypothetical protein
MHDDSGGAAADRWAARALLACGFLLGALVGVFVAPDWQSHLQPLGVDQFSFRPAVPIILACAVAGAFLARDRANPVWSPSVVPDSPSGLPNKPLQQSAAPRRTSTVSLSPVVKYHGLGCHHLLPHRLLRRPQLVSGMLGGPESSRRMDRTELKQLLEAGGFDESCYSLAERPPYDALYLHQHPNRDWAIYYFERGHARILGTYPSEDEACRRFYHLLSEDPTTRRR